MFRCSNVGNGLGWILVFILDFHPLYGLEKLDPDSIDDDIDVETVFTSGLNASCKTNTFFNL